MKGIHYNSNHADVMVSMSKHQS